GDAAGTGIAPHQVVHRIDALQVHGDAFQTVGDLTRYRAAVQAADLLEVGELGDLHAVQPHFPAEAPGAERRRLPVVLDEAHVVLLKLEAEVAQRLEIHVLDVGG